jgi:hypothetical protein
MKDEYTEAFYGLVKETQDTSGFALPEHLEAYVVMLLSSHVNKSNFLPNSSFAECYLRLERPATMSAKELGDTCLFVSGVFPSYGKKHGINRRYYQDIGIGSYELASESFHRDLFSELAKHFIFLSEFIKITTDRSDSKIFKDIF